MRVPSSDPVYRCNLTHGRPSVMSVLVQPVASLCTFFTLPVVLQLTPTPILPFPPLIAACVAIREMDLERTAALPASKGPCGCSTVSGVWRPRGELFFYYYSCYYHHHYYYYHPETFSCLLSKNAKIRIYKAITLPIVLYGCETWSLTLREKHRLRVFENKVQRRIFGPKWDKVTGE
jgi:hypothetical protein